MQRARVKRSKRVKTFLEDTRTLATLPVDRRHIALALEEYCFDAQLLTLSRLYRTSRKSYRDLGGRFASRISSGARSLDQGLFDDSIDYSPAESEVLWLKDNIDSLAEPDAEVDALLRFNDSSLFHEQNHRILWRLLPPAPREEQSVKRYLNFAESLVVALDIALAEEVGRSLSLPLQRVGLLYRQPGKNRWQAKSKAEYRQYLLAIVFATYCFLTLIENDDVVKAVNYVLPNQKQINKDAVACSLGLSEKFALVTSPNWQRKYWQHAGLKLSELQRESTEKPLVLPDDLLDLDAELFLARRVLKHYGL